MKVDFKGAPLRVVDNMKQHIHTPDKRGHFVGRERAGSRVMIDH
jgi:hypothetical protein